MVGNRIGRGRRRAPRRIVADDHAVDMSGGGVLERLGRQPEQVGCNDRACAAVGKLMGELALCVERTQVHRAFAGAHGAEETHRMIGRIGKIERDRSVGAQTQECSRGAIGRSRQLPIADAAVTIFQRRAVAELRDRAIEQLRYRRGRNRRVPAHPGGIGLLPHKGAAGAHHAPFAASAQKLPFSFASRLSNADGSCRASPLSRASRASRSRMRESPTVSA